MDKIQRGVGRDIFFDNSKHPLSILFVTSFWRPKLIKGIFGDGSYIDIDFTTFLSLNLFGKNDSTISK